MSHEGSSYFYLTLSLLPCIIGITLLTSGFMDDVVFAHKPRLHEVAAQLKCTAHAALGLAINCAQ